MAILNNDTDVSVLVDGLDHVEGIAWGLDGYCYAGGEAGQIYRIDIERKEAVQIADTSGFILGLAIDSEPQHLCVRHGQQGRDEDCFGRRRDDVHNRCAGRAVQHPQLPSVRRRRQPVRVRLRRLEVRQRQDLQGQTRWRDRGLESLAVRVSQRSLRGSRRHAACSSL